MTSLVYTPRAQRSHVDQTTKHTVSTVAANYARSQWPQNSHGAQYAQTSLRPHVPRRFRGKTNQALPKRNWPRVPGISLEGSGIPSGEPLALWGVSQVVALRAPKVFAPLRTLGAIVKKAMTHQLRIETARSSKGMLPSRSKRSIANTPHQTLIILHYRYPKWSHPMTGSFGPLRPCKPSNSPTEPPTTPIKTHANRSKSLLLALYNPS